MSPISLDAVGMVQNALSCHTITKALQAPWILCSFSCCTVPMHEDSHAKCEMHHIYICV